MSGALLCLTQVAAAQPVASPYANVDNARVIIQPRIMLSPAEQNRLQAYADRGIAPLRQYLWRTRMIYNYSMADLLNVS
jgi:hypothetical protein